MTLFHQSVTTKSSSSSENHSNSHRGTLLQWCPHQDHQPRSMSEHDLSERLLQADVVHGEALSDHVLQHNIPISGKILIHEHLEILISNRLPYWHCLIVVVVSFLR